MTDIYFDVTKTNGAASGIDWLNGKPLRLLSQFYSTTQPAMPGDRYFIGCDPKNEYSYFLAGEKLNLDRNGTAESNIEINYGGFGNRISTANSQISINIIGDRNNPFMRGDPVGSSYINVYASHNKITGINAYNLDALIDLMGSVEGLGVADIYAENVSYVFNSDDTHNLVNSKFENVHGKNLTKGLIRIPPNSSDITVSNFSCTNESAESGEFRGINIRENCSNITISKGYICGAISMYTEDEPSVSGSYNQGDGINAENGINLKIREVTIKDCTDRGIDVKSVCDIYMAEIYGCKIGIATWADGSTVRNCKVINPRGNSNNKAFAYQAIGKTSYFNCEAEVVGNDVRGVFDFSVGGFIIGGKYRFDPSKQYFIRSPSQEIKVRLINVDINGNIYSGLLTISAGQTWVP